MLRQNSRLLRTLAIASFLGAASVAAFAPLGWFPVIGPTLAGLYALLCRAADESSQGRERLKKGALLGGAFGFGLFIAGVSWIYVSLNTFGGMAAPFAALATLLFCGFISLYPTLACAVFVRFPQASCWQRASFFAALWTLSEWLRAWIFTGFPWLSIGYSQTPPSPLAGYAPVLGIFGVSLITALTVALAVEAVRHFRARVRQYRIAIASTLIAILLLAGGALLRQIQWTQPSGAPVSVALLQGNVSQALKWRPEQFVETLRTYYRLTAENPAGLTILPETAFPAFLDQVPKQYLDELRTLAERQKGDLIFGIVTGDSTQYTNSAVSLGISPEQRYGKSHLVPFGEFIPPGFAWFLSLANIPMSEFTPGSRNQPLMDIAGQKIAINICYEDAFGEEIIRALPQATLLVNISNVAWFGDSLAPAQHLQIARLRALETGRTMLRATNTGMTAIVEPNGEVRAVLPAFTRAALRRDVQGFTGTTPYVRVGNWPVIAFSLAIVLAFAQRRNAVS